MSQNIDLNTPEEMVKLNAPEALRRLHILNVHEIFLNRFYTVESLVEFLLDDSQLTAYPGISPQILTEIYEPQIPTVFEGFKIVLNDVIKSLEERDENEDIEFRTLMQNVAFLFGVNHPNRLYGGFPEWATVNSIRIAIERLKENQ
jgi:hypothetical protein